MKIESDGMYFKSYEEVHEKLGEFQGVIENTSKIAEKCNLELEFGKFKFPNYQVPESFKNIKDYLRYLVEEGLKNRYELITEEIRNRTEFELGIINKMGYEAYFVLVPKHIFVIVNMEQKLENKKALYVNGKRFFDYGVV
jgi:DNA polymerase-3 subunit alpha